MTDNQLVIGDNRLTVADLAEATHGRWDVALSDDAVKRITSARTVVEDALKADRPLYGINTGVGSQKDVQFSQAAIHDYNRKLLKAHATRMPGPLLPEQACRAGVIILLNGFTRGQSGIRAETAQLLARLIGETHQWPLVRAGSSVGAADLVLLAQLMDGLMPKDWQPEAKEALSLMSSNAIALAQLALALEEVGRYLTQADRVAVLTMEGFRANLQALQGAQLLYGTQDPHCFAVDTMIANLKGSLLWQPGQARFLQDPLSYRCVPQVHGALWPIWQTMVAITETAMNSSVDNPMVDVEGAQLIGHGHCDTTVLTLHADMMRQALARQSVMGGERMHKQHWPAFSGLPSGLAEENRADQGVQFLNLGHLAEAQIAQIRLLAQPVLLSYAAQLADGVEDTAGLAPQAAQHLNDMLPLLWQVQAIEAAIASWAIHRRGLSVSDIGEGVRELHHAILPLLPIGREGEEVWDMTAVVDVVKST